MKIQVGETVLFADNIDEAVDIIVQILTHVDPKKFIIDDVEEIRGDILKELLNNGLLNFYLRVKNNIRIHDSTLITYRGFNLYGRNISDIFKFIKNELKKQSSNFFDKIGRLYDQLRYSNSIIVSITDADEIVNKDYTKVIVNSHLIFVDSKYKSNLYQIVQTANKIVKSKFGTVDIREGVFDKYLLVYSNDSMLPALLVKKYDFLFNEVFFNEVLKIYDIMHDIVYPMRTLDNFFNTLAINDIKITEYFTFKGDNPFIDILLGNGVYNRYFLKNSNGKINITPRNIDDFKNMLDVLKIELKV